MSSLLQTVRDLWRVKLTVTQVAFTFILSAFNWAALTWWTTVSLPKLLQGTATFFSDLLLTVGLVLVLLLPVLLSVIGTMRFPEKILISPLDINLVTIGIFAVTLWFSLNPLANPSGQLIGLIGYVLALFVTGVFLVPIGSIGNNAAVGLMGLEGNEAQLRTSVLHSKFPQDQVVNIIASQAKQKATGLIYREDLEDGTVCFYGQVESVFLHVAASKAREGKSTTISVVAFQIASFGLKQVDELWFKSRLASLLTALRELQLTEDPNGLVTRSVIDHVLLPTKGVVTRFQEAWAGIARPLIAAIVLGLADYFAFTTGVIKQQDTAIELGFFIFLYVLGITIASTRKRLRR